MKKKSDDERKAYDGSTLKEGEVLVPMIADENFIRTHELTNDKLRKWSTCGIDYLVAFYPLPAEDVDIAMKEYRWEVNQMLDNKLGRNRDARCLIPQSDGSVIVCPKKRGDNHPACRDCPYKGIYEREDKATVSFEELGDEYELCPAAPDDTEKEVLYPMMLEELMAELKEKDIRTYSVLKLCAEGMERREVIQSIMDEFNLKKTMAYDVFKDAVRMVEECLYS